MASGYRVEFDLDQWWLIQGNFTGEGFHSRADLVERIEEEIEETEEEFESFDAEDREAEREFYQKTLTTLRKLAEEYA